MASKPFDQAFKSLPEASPRGLLDATGILPREQEAEVELLPQEIASPIPSLDRGMVVRPEGAEPFVAIFESFASFRSRSLDQVIEYSKRVDSLFPHSQRVFFVPLYQAAYPREAPSASARLKGSFEVRVQIEWILPWEIDAARFLEQNHPAFDAWTVLCRSSEAQVDEAIRRLRSRPSDLARYRTLGGLRYRGQEAGMWLAFLERMDQMITKEDLRESLAVQEWLQEGRIEGRREGRQEGRQETAEELLRAAMSRYPQIELPPRFPDSIPLAAAAKEVLLAPDEASVRLVLRSHGLIQ